MAPSRDDVSHVELGLDSFGCAQWLHEVNRTLGLSSRWPRSAVTRSRTLSALIGAPWENR
ncbi:hypothetical protein LV779_34545 [Streptomyces thinghirensis]|nr:hypothetical protein [Streptomyces thinghirensis]